MKHVAVIVIVALIGAGALWALSEFSRFPHDEAIRVRPSENGQDTAFTHPGIGTSAQLPGRGWTEGPAPEGTGIWFNANKDLAFSVRPTGANKPGSGSELGDHAQAHAARELTRAVVAREDFHGAAAYRVEGIGAAGPLQNYHCLGYIFIPHGEETALLACASRDAWADQAKRSLVSAILAGVVLK